jgi:hypothetical protein
MSVTLSPIRHAWLRAVGPLLLALAVVPAAWAHQQSSSAETAAPEKPATKTATAAHHHRTAGTTAGKKTTSKASTAKRTTDSDTTQSTSTKSTSKTRTATRKRSSRSRLARARGQQKIDSERAEQIQEALIRAHYLTGEPTGTWNAASEEAMRQYQADHGWQTKEVPDSRALIKLGLGPSKDGLLNPESAMTTSPEAPKAASLPDSPKAASLQTVSHTAPTTAAPAAPGQSTTTPNSPPASVPAQSTVPSDSQPPQ